MHNHKQFLQVRPQDGYWAIEYNSPKANVVFGLEPLRAFAESKLGRLLEMSDSGLDAVLQRHGSKTNDTSLRLERV